jgi:hypothetical protein
MGTGDALSCRKISKPDLEWIESQAGVSVEARPGEVLLNKDSSSQNLVVGYPTNVFAAPGETTTAPGVSTYCIDHSKLPPAVSGFDVGPSAASLAGYEAIGKLAELNGQLQPSLTEPVFPVQAALWNQTDGTPLGGGLYTAEASAEAAELLKKVGAGENTTGKGPAHLEDPNANSTTTGAVDGNGNVLLPESAEEVSPPPTIEIDAALFQPKVISSSQVDHGNLLVGAVGTVSSLGLKLQSRVGNHWRSVKALPDRKLTTTGVHNYPLKLGRLQPGKYRLLVTVSGPSGETATKSAALTVRPTKGKK